MRTRISFPPSGKCGGLGKKGAAATPGRELKMACCCCCCCATAKTRTHASPIPTKAPPADTGVVKQPAVIAVPPRLRLLPSRSTKHGRIVNTEETAAQNGVGGQKGADEPGANASERHPYRNGCTMLQPRGDIGGFFAPDGHRNQRGRPRGTKRDRPLGPFGTNCIWPGNAAFCTNKSPGHGQRWRGRLSGPRTE